MALTDVPSITTIKDRIVSDVETKISDTVPDTLLSFVKVFAGALAVVIHLLYQTVAWVYKQIFPQTQAVEALRLEGEAIGVIYQTATFGIVSATVTGTDPEVTAGTTFNGPNQVTYRVDTTTSIPGAVDMTALSSGTIGNLSTGDKLNLATSTPGIDSVATVIEMTSTAEADEDIEDYRERVIIRKRTKFIYGSPAGYVLSGLETPNFIWVGPYADVDQPGVVDVYGRVDLALATDGIPTAPQLVELENYLTLDNGTGQEIRRPISDELNVLAVTNREFDVEITIQGANAALKTSIETANEDKIQSYEPFITGVSVSRNDTLTNSDLVVVSDAIATPEGAKVISIQITDVTAASVISSYQFLGGVFGIARNITFVDV